jgi:hypothetical protein
MSQIVEQTKQTLLRSRQVSEEAVKSGTYVYPPHGVVYLVHRPALWSPIRAAMIPCILLSIAVIIPMFFFTYLPQAAILTLMNGPVGPFNAVLLVLSESGTIINAIARSFILDQALYDIFDATLVNEGQTELVSRGRELKHVDNKQGAKKLGKMITKPLEKYVSSTYHITG